MFETLLYVYQKFTKPGLGNANLLIRTAEGGEINFHEQSIARQCWCESHDYPLVAQNMVSLLLSSMLNNRAHRIDDSIDL